MIVFLSFSLYSLFSYFIITSEADISSQTGKKGNIPKANERIDAEKVRVVADDGEMLGLMKLAEAIALASGKGMDLVEVSRQDDVPICKMLDFGKFKFDKQRKEQKNRKKQKVVHIKEIKLRPVTGEHDYLIKLKAARKFIEAGDKVKVSLRFRGREITHQEVGSAIMERMIADMEDVAKTESALKSESRQLLLVLAPK
ncbi:MAG: translation initiation factor IF-3 [Rickettsiales bacterium]